MLLATSVGTSREKRGDRWQAPGARRLSPAVKSSRKVDAFAGTACARRAGMSSGSSSGSSSSSGGSPLLQGVRDALLLRHYSPKTIEAYMGWVRRFVLFHGRRHPRELGAREVSAFLLDLASRVGVSASTQNQALAALLFLHAEVLQQPLGSLGEVVHAKRPARLPVVMTRSEVDAVLSQLEGVWRLMASLLYGAGLRLLEWRVCA